MIVATKTCDSLLKGVVSKDKLMISRMDTISSNIQLDPNISTPKKEMFIISNDDIKNVKIRNEFLEALKGKHPKAIIMYIDKSGREIPGVTMNLFDAYIEKPKKGEVREKFLEMVEEAESKSKLEVSATIETIEELNPDLVNSKETKKDINKEIERVEEESVVTLDIEEVQKEDSVDENTEEDNELLRRIKDSEHWAGLASVAKEISAARIVTELSKSNADFKHSENYIRSLQENITAIMANPEYNTTEKLTKVRSIMHDRSHLKAKTNSIVEQAVEEIIMLVVDKAKEEVESKTESLEEDLLLAMKNRSITEAPNVRIATIIEQRTNLLIELNALDLEIKGIASTCIDTINDTVENVVTDGTSTTESPILDSQMKARYGEMVPENLLNVVDNLFVLGKESSKEFGRMSESVNSIIRKLYQLLSLYQDESEVLADTIKYLKANNVEDTVLANSILKKTNRIFISNGDFDSMAIGYIIAKHNSRRHNNVLLLDITGSNVFNLFNIKQLDYSTFMEENKFDEKLLVVTRDVNAQIETDEDCQRLESRLLHYAKHYSMINIICSPEQEVFLRNFKSEVLSISYLVDCYPTTIKRMARCIAETEVKNTAYKIILTNYITDSASICNELGIMERLEVQLATVGPIESIRHCTLRKQDPYDVGSIVEDCGGVLKIC